MNLNIFDIGIILILISFIIAGWKNGVVKEASSFLGIIVVFVLSYSLKGIVGNFLCSILPFFKFNGLVTMNILLYHIIAFILLFLILLSLYKLLLKISNGLQKIINYTIILLIPSKVLGAIISLIEGWIITFIILVILIMPLGNERMFNNSKLVNIVLYKTPVLSNMTKSYTNSINEIYDLTSKIKEKEISTEEANKKTLNIMLKYKVVNKNTIKKLIKLNKLNEIKDINDVLDKH
ncbi:MAG: CvpA family protein [Bacilli bacterium]|nr:CvpA family protein [Bacilli bacterium]